MHERRVDAVRLEARDREDPAVVHDDRVALGVAAAGGAADQLRFELLVGVVSRDRSGHDVGAAALAVKIDGVGADRMLVAVSHEALADDELRARLELGDRLPVRVVDALDLDHLHLHGAVLFHVDFRDRVQNALAGAVAGAVVLFHIFDLRALLYKEAVDAVVL